MYIKRLLTFPTHECFVCYKYIISNTDEIFHNQLLLKMPANGIQAKGLHQEAWGQGAQSAPGDFSILDSGRKLVIVHMQLHSQYNNIPRNMNMTSSSFRWNREILCHYCHIQCQTSCNNFLLTNSSVNNRVKEGHFLCIVYHIFTLLILAKNPNFNTWDPGTSSLPSSFPCS